LTWKFLRKLAIVFVGAFFTTLTFYFLIDPNGLYNSGLNGLLQTVSKWFVGHSDKISWGSYYLLYYGLGLLINLFFIFILRFFFKAKLEIISTSIFYVISQIIWTQIFKIANLREYIFSRFNPTSWQGLSSQSQLSFTLPYYIVIAIVAAIIHTYGYSLIFQAQATPGGLELFTSHFSSQKKSKFSIGTFTKLFGFAIIFLVTLINFRWIENNPQMKKSNLEKDIEEIKEKNEQLQGKTPEFLLEKWKSDMRRIKELKESEEKEDIKESFEIREKNRFLTNLLKNKTGETDLENFPQEVDYYLESEEGKLNKLKKEEGEIGVELNSSSGKELKEKLQRKNYLQSRISKIKRERDKGNVITRYLSYITNNERLWATMVYIFLSSFLISQIFPRDKTVLLRLHSLTEEGRNKGFKLLEKFSPFYYTVYHRKGEKEEVIYVINCYMSKWNYYLLSPYLKQVGKTYINETN
jgi:uncharacterized membrane-anchored protein YitT (DUF2179 family)